MDGPNLSPEMQATLTSVCQTRMETLRTVRLPWWQHWGQLAEMFLPRRYRWFITPNQWTRGSPMNQSIVDETGLLSARTLASGLLSGLTSPTKPWFRLAIHGMEDVDSGPVRSFMAECETRLGRVYAESNFYQALGESYHQLSVFGSSPMIQYEDYEDVVRFYVPCLGEFMYALDNRLVVSTLYREYTYTACECVDEFGLENCSDNVQTLYKTPSGRDTEVIIGHVIEPNYDVYLSGVNYGCPLPASFSYREVFWESSTQGKQGNNSPLRVRGFREKPFVGARWDVTSNDPYGRSPGMDALPAVRQSQIMVRRQAEAIDKMVRPPMVASVAMKNEPMSILPGGISYVADVANNGFKPAFTVDPRLQELDGTLEQVRQRIGEIFFVPLFLMFNQLSDTTMRTATEIDARKEEKLIQLGPVIERFENEVLNPTIQRTFNIMRRKGLLPPEPPEIAGKPIVIQYISMLAEAQRAAQTTAIERLLQFAGGLVAVQPQALDNVDVDEAIEEYGNLLNVPTHIIRDAKGIAAIRQARTQQQQQAAALQASTALAQGAKTLSQTDVGGGQNALQRMIG